MSIKRFFSEKDNTITNAFKPDLTTRGTLANMGESDVMEVYSVYGQSTTSSVEKSRIIIKFPVDKIVAHRDAGTIPTQGKTQFVIRLHNAEHGDTIPSDYTLALSPLLQAWEEGHGLDMETFGDTGHSNWLSSSDGVTWLDPGGTFAKRSKMNSKDIPSEYTQHFKTGLENLEINVTDLAEEWIKDHKNQSKHATASIEFPDPAGGWSQGDQYRFYSTNGNSELWQFSTKSVSEAGVYYFETSLTPALQALKFSEAINNNSALFSARHGDGLGGETSKVYIYQSTPGYYGNTLVSSSSGLTGPTHVHFANGAGVKNYGVVIRLSGSYETGDLKRSYFTKKFFTRTSEFFLKRPNLEVQYNNSIQDDRGDVVESSALMPTADNLNKIYFYNKTRAGSIKDIPSTGSDLVVQFYTSSNTDGDPVVLPVGGGVSSHSTTFVTASRHSLGIYSAQFSCTGSGTTLYDVWKKTNDDAGHVYTTLFTGSGFLVGDHSPPAHYDETGYVTNITNLKKSYAQDEEATFRIYTRNKNWSPNVYTVARKSAPINNIREGYYKIKRVIDNYEVIGYSTSSAVSYSRLSYDMSGSFFDLDMSILEPNYLYEIGLLFKQNNVFKEQKERFRFRVE